MLDVGFANGRTPDRWSRGLSFQNTRLGVFRIGLSPLLTSPCAPPWDLGGVDEVEALPCAGRETYLEVLGLERNRESSTAARWARGVPGRSSCGVGLSPGTRATRLVGICIL
jgi:hypothetical protein